MNKIIKLREGVEEEAKMLAREEALRLQLDHSQKYLRAYTTPTICAECFAPELNGGNFKHPEVLKFMEHLRYFFHPIYDVILHCHVYYKSIYGAELDALYTSQCFDYEVIIPKMEEIIKAYDLEGDLSSDDGELDMQIDEMRDSFLSAVLYLGCLYTAQELDDEKEESLDKGLKALTTFRKYFKVGTQTQP